MFLSQENIERLTGRSRASAQRRWLLEHGFPHEVNALGFPVVLCSVVEERLGAKAPKKAKPNFAALHSNCTVAASSHDKGTTAGAA